MGTLVNSLCARFALTPSASAAALGHRKCKHFLRHSFCTLLGCSNYNNLIPESTEGATPYLIPTICHWIPSLTVEDDCEELTNN